MGIRYSGVSVSDGYRDRTQRVFGGYDHRLGNNDGTVYDTTNMSGDFYPLAAPRAPRVISRRLTKPNGITGYDGVYYADGTGFYDNGELVGTVTDSRKRFAFLGKILVILPDKAYYNTETHEFGSLEAVWSGTASFADGTYAGEDAEACRIITSGEVFPFKVGDAVTISGADDEGNNKTLVIREISDDKKNLGFYEHSFTVSKNQTITVSRTVPDLDFICENENRLYGCRGDTVYVSKLGDAFNWNVFDGLDSDSYAVAVGSAGDFTACYSYGGYAIFFKEDRVYKLYGDKPSNYQLMSSASLGVMRGADASLATAGEALFYLSRCGIMIYNGGIPSSIAAEFGGVRYCDAVGGSDGMKYYVSMKSITDGTWNLFCYDTRYRLWFREDSTEAVGFANYDGLRMLAADGTLYRIGAFTDSEDGDIGEGPVSSMMEFFDITESSPDRKHLCKLQLRIMLSQGAEVSVYMSFDDGEYIHLGTLTKEGKDSYYLPVPLHRCDFYRIRLCGKGDWKLFSLNREYSPGSEL